MCPLYLTELLSIMKTSCYSLRLNRHNMCPLYLTELLSIMKTSCYSLRLNRALPVGTNVIQIYKILLQLKLLNEHYLVLFVVSQLMYTGFTIHEGLKLLTTSIGHLREHKCRHNFNDTIYPFCLCGTNNIETSEHFFLHCPTYACLRLKLFDNLRNNNILFLPGKALNCTNSSLRFR